MLSRESKCELMLPPSPQSAGRRWPGWSRPGPLLLRLLLRVRGQSPAGGQPRAAGPGPAAVPLRGAAPPPALQRAGAAAGERSAGASRSSEETKESEQRRVWDCEGARAAGGSEGAPVFLLC